jgi:hypothetical protein
MDSDTCELLLVDGRTDLVSLLYSHLARRQGFRVERLQTPGEAVSRLSSHQLDLILSNDDTPEGQKHQRLATLQGILLVQVKNERKTSRKSHFILLPNDIIVLEDADQRVVFSIPELSREGQEGRNVGTSFVLGDAAHMLERSRQITLNSFVGQARAFRTVTDLRNKEGIKNFGQLDGAFVVTGDGLIEAPGRPFLVEEITLEIPPGKAPGIPRWQR